MNRSISCFGVTRDSFIFSFKNDDSIENCILSRVMKNQQCLMGYFKSYMIAKVVKII